MLRRPGFPISADARQRLDPEGRLFAPEGGIRLTGIPGARLVALGLNRHRGGGTTTRAGSIHALAVLQRVLRDLFDLFRRESGADPLRELWSWLADELGPDRLQSTLLSLTEAFPPPELLRGELSAVEFLEGETDGVPHRLVLLEELLVVWWINRNPALHDLRILFDDQPLSATAYPEIGQKLPEFFRTTSPAREDGTTWIELLSQPVEAAPRSLRRQLRLFSETPEVARIDPPARPRNESVVRRLLVAHDLLQEEEKAAFTGPGPVEIPVFADLEGTPRRHARERPWMRTAVLGAKHVRVWLHQLSAELGRSISRLDQIPQRELTRLRSLGWNVLWLIGVWEQSPASRQIKRRCGNPEAEASAYALFDYRVAQELGGTAALTRLRRKADRAGIRLSTDMVPNHTGIDSRWVFEHPERFLSLRESPYPGYTFEGPELSDDPRVSIRLEDHYYDRSDAAVVFRREQLASGEVRFLYHGNDGTGLPWNDTAQLNYLNPEVREAVIEQILEVARRFPAVRFDAAMTLTRQHYQRLWYPAPGEGGDIPSRSEHGVDPEVFDALMPEEFWWEVAQRVRREAPDTLLIAEAFWLLEGYFARSLGIHRVYNSAFMHTLREENPGALANFLRAILAFDPEIASRLVNFLSNPDEESARQQFGAGDKYFAATTLLATLPGLPMFAHGQVEGLAEKYGMEYSRAYRRESPDAHLLERHRIEILPLLERRELFAGSERFELVPFEREDGELDPGVLAFSNGLGEQRALVVVNFAERSTRGRLLRSAPKRAGSGDPQSRSLVEALRLSSGRGYELVDPRHDGQVVVEPPSPREGLELELGPFQTVVALLAPTEQPSTASLGDELRRRCSELRPTLSELDPLQKAFSSLLLTREPGPLADLLAEPLATPTLPGVLEEQLRSLEEHLEQNGLSSEEPAVGVLLVANTLLDELAELDDDHSARELFDLWHLGPAVGHAARQLDLPAALAQDLVSCLRALLALGSAAELLPLGALDDPDVRDLLRVHEHDNESWIDREGLDRLLWSRFLLRSLQRSCGLPELAELLALQEAARHSGYRLEPFLQLLRAPTP